jgi:hypothetical protein
VLPRSTYHSDGRVKAGYCQTPYDCFLMWSRTTKRNVIGLCELIVATTYGTKDIGDYIESVLTIEDIQGFLKISRRQAYAAREDAVKYKWLEHRQEPGVVGDIYRFFPQRVQETPELTHRRSRQEPELQGGTAYVHDNVSLAAFTVHPDAQPAPLCTGSPSCPYIKENGQRPAAERAKDSADIAAKGDATGTRGTPQLEKYLRDKFARRFRKNPDPALLARLASILDTRGASFDDFRLYVDAKDQRDSIKGYGLLPALAGECLIGEQSPGESNDNLSPEQWEYLRQVERSDARSRGNHGN